MIKYYLDNQEISKDKFLDLVDMNDVNPIAEKGVNGLEYRLDSDELDVWSNKSYA